MPEKLHHDEVIVNLLVEQFDKDIENLIEYATVGGRPMFNVALSPEEQIARFNNPVMRQQIIDRIVADGDPQGLSKYFNHLKGLMGVQKEI
jgi:hypothetical protein